MRLRFWFPLSSWGFHGPRVRRRQDPISAPPSLLDQVMGPVGLLWELPAPPRSGKSLSFSKTQVLAPWHFQPHLFPAL